ncbi:hypothetical protein EDB84DRAFT_1628878 [Lactarius hengduanensis]|nr:hypothetical protein EDB84DRAFT_1628878 [Lactarius hengduanensis]
MPTTDALPVSHTWTPTASHHHHFRGEPTTRRRTRRGASRTTTTRTTTTDGTKMVWTTAQRWREKLGFCALLSNLSHSSDVLFGTLGASDRSRCRRSTSRSTICGTVFAFGAQVASMRSARTKHVLGHESAGEVSFLDGFADRPRSTFLRSITVHPSAAASGPLPLHPARSRAAAPLHTPGGMVPQAPAVPLLRGRRALEPLLRRPCRHRAANLQLERCGAHMWLGADGTTMARHVTTTTQYGASRPREDYADGRAMTAQPRPLPRRLPQTDHNERPGRSGGRGDGGRDDGMATGRDWDGAAPLVPRSALDQPDVHLFGISKAAELISDEFSHVPPSHIYILSSDNGALGSIRNTRSLTHQLEVLRFHTALSAFYSVHRDTRIHLVWSKEHRKRASDTQARLAALEACTNTPSTQHQASPVPHLRQKGPASPRLQGLGQGMDLAGQLRPPPTSPCLRALHSLPHAPRWAQPPPMVRCHTPQKRRPLSGNPSHDEHTAQPAARHAPLISHPTTPLSTRPDLPPEAAHCQCGFPNKSFYHVIYDCPAYEQQRKYHLFSSRRPEHTKPLELFTGEGDVAHDLCLFLQDSGAASQPENVPPMPFDPG